LASFRKKDINLNIGIGNKSDNLNFYQINARILSTFDKSVADQAVIEGYKIENIYQVEVKPLKSIFEQYCSSKTVDFLSLDVEGFELEVLKSNDWHKFRPRFLCIEINRRTDEIHSFLKKIDYKETFENVTNSIFYDSLNVPAPHLNKA
jgi:FkbM family methyltransferase